MDKQIAFIIYSEENGKRIDTIKIRWDDLLKESKETISVNIGKTIRCWEGTARQERMVRVSSSPTTCTYHHIIESYHSDVMCYSYVESEDQSEMIIFDLINKRVKRVIINSVNPQYKRKRNNNGKIIQYGKA